jgi:hypothetical protein
MECVILFRNTQNGRVGFVSDGDEIAVYPNYDEAAKASDDIPICQAFPHQIVELEDL